MKPGENTKKKKSTGWILALVMLLAVAGGLYYFKPWETPEVPTEGPPETQQTEAQTEPEKEDVGKSAADEKKEKPAEDPGKEPDGKTEEPEEKPEEPEDKPGEEKPEEPTQPTQPTQPAEPEPPAHTHTWVHHDAVTHTVHHDATYKTIHHDAETTQKYVVDQEAVWQGTYHCTCGYTTTSKEEMTAHQKNASWDEEHNVSVTEEKIQDEVGHYETVVVKEAWDETVVDQPAWDETIVDQAAYDECSGCGARK